MTPTPPSLRTSKDVVLTDESVLIVTFWGYDDSWADIDVWAPWATALDIRGAFFAASNDVTVGKNMLR